MIKRYSHVRYGARHVHKMLKLLTHFNDDVNVVRPVIPQNAYFAGDDTRQNDFLYENSDGEEF